MIYLSLTLVVKASGHESLTAEWQAELQKGDVAETQSVPERRAGQHTSIEQRVEGPEGRCQAVK
jgi:hypothetical protein